MSKSVLSFCIAALVLSVSATSLAESSDAGGSRETAGAVSTDSPGSPKKVHVGDNAVSSSLNLKLRDIRNGWFFRLSDFCHSGKGRSYQQKKTVVLDFFSTDCVMCKKMLPRLADFARRHGDKVQVLLIAVPEKDDVEGRKLRSYFNRNPVPFPVLEDPSGYQTKRWLPVVNGIADMPYLFLVDKEGKVRAEVPGYHDSIDAALSPALGEALGM